MEDSPLTCRSTSCCVLGSVLPDVRQKAISGPVRNMVSRLPLLLESPISNSRSVGDMRQNACWPISQPWGSTAHSTVAESARFLGNRLD